MKLGSRQIIGLVAIVVFGGGMVWRMTQPSQREIMDQRLATLPRISDAIEMPDFPPVQLPTTTPVVPEIALHGGAAAGSDEPVWKLSGIDYYALGSQPAKDDLYCAGVLSTEFSAIVSTAHPDASSILLRDSQALEKAGLDKLKAEGHASDSNWAGFSLAWSDKAEADYNASTLRLPVDTCKQRAAALQ